MEQLSQSPAGGALIGLSAVWLYLSLGKIAGISGIVAGVFQRDTVSNGGDYWRLFFIMGLGLGGWLAISILGKPIPASTLNPTALLIGGTLVGFGVRLGSGCTSGHGVCGVARFSPRSFAATGTFLLTAIITATLVGAL